MHHRAIIVPIACLLAASWMAWEAPPAFAHGGAFGPPPPTHRSGPPGGGGPPSHVDPGFGGPIVTPAGGAPTTGRASKRKTPITPSFETSWQLWWSLNRDAWLPGRRPKGMATPMTPAGGPRSWEVQRRALVTKRVAPVLLAIVGDADQPDDVVASAALALGKIAATKEVADALFALVLDPSREGLVRESGALALGLLRRTRQEERLQTRQVEEVRARLLQVFDTHVDGHKLRVPIRTRAFAAFSLALLGDQPYQDHPVTRDGRLISKLLWERLSLPYPDRELHIALLHAIGRQPRAGLPDGVVDGLREIVKGSSVGGHRWDVLKRAHAVTAVSRLGGPSAGALLLRMVNDRRRNVVVRLAASIAPADRAGELASAERGAALRVMRRAFDLEQEMLGVGLANIAFGRMVGADLAAGSTRALEVDEAHKLLLARAQTAPWYVRGFALIGLALAAREATADADLVRDFRARTLALLQRLARTGDRPTVRGAALVSLGLLGDPNAAPALQVYARDATLDPEVRGHAALALGQVGAPGGAVEVLGALVAAEGTPDIVRGNAALALSLVGESHVAKGLIADLSRDLPTRRLAATATALGRLGHLAAVEPLLAAAGNEQHRPLARAMALVALGRLLDPEPKPSLLRLTTGACYPARSHALQEVFTIL